MRLKITLLEQQLQLAVLEAEDNTVNSYKEFRIIAIKRSHKVA